ncbi:Serine/threonine-protein kinase PknB [Neorhodopirellula pilleata]|uniref:Serine/threonine-protein kinase PknB n=2 Tax=Neorhodopirellula pilleata TaxID=2714738 RepID=A0A5C5ZKZ5_9BACT|nr:Serine/threonine-protein kinase PknB [Neorhodopirellula pilleata]
MPSTKPGNVSGAIDDSWSVDHSSLDERYPSNLRSIAHLSVGTRLDRYQIVRLLGSGGSSDVYLAQDQNLGRRVAIKILRMRFDASDPSNLRFRREAELSAMLDHPHLIRVLDANLMSDPPYIVSEFCEGLTLRQWLSEQSGGTLHHSLVAKLARQLADGLDTAHRLHLIHRDIKPSNVMISQDSDGSLSARLMDFGLAFSLSASRHTRTGICVGTVAYMSPEQVLGNQTYPAKTSDVYSLGVLMYECLTGISPFVADSPAAMLDRVRRHEPTPVHLVRPEIPKDLSAICHRCLDKSPERRYLDAAELRADLDRYLSGRSTVARSLGAWGRSVRWARRNPVTTLAMTMVLISLMTGTISLALFAYTKSNVASRLTEQSEALSLALEQVQLAESKVTKQAYQADMQLAYMRYADGQFGDVEEILSRHPNDRIEAQLLKKAIVDQYRTLSIQPGPVHDLVVTPQLDRYVTVGEDGYLRYWDLETGKLIRQAGGIRSSLHSIDLLDNGDEPPILLLAGHSWPWGGRHLIKLGFDDHAIKRVLQYHPTTIESIRTSYDQSIIASQCRYEGIKVWHEDTKREVFIKSHQRGESFGLSPDGKWIVTGKKHYKELQVFDSHTGSLSHRYAVGCVSNLACCGNRLPIAAFHLDGKNELGLVDYTDPNSEVEILAVSDEVSQIAFSPDDRFLAVAGLRSGVECFRRDPSSPSKWKRLGTFRGTLSRVNCLRFIDTDRLLVGLQNGHVEMISPEDQSASISDSHTTVFEHYYQALHQEFDLNEDMVSPGGRCYWMPRDSAMVLTTKQDKHLFAYERRGDRWIPRFDVSFDKQAQSVGCYVAAQEIFVGTENEIVILSFEGKVLRRRPVESLVRAMKIGPHEESLWMTLDDGTIHRLDPVTLQTLEILHDRDQRGHSVACYSIAFWGDDRMLALDMYGHLQVWDLDTGSKFGSIPWIPSTMACDRDFIQTDPQTGTIQTVFLRSDGRYQRNRCSLNGVESTDQ